MSVVNTALRGLVLVVSASRPVKTLGFIALMAIAALSLRFLLAYSFVYVNWADALSYAEGARRVSASMSPYSAMQLAGPYPLDNAAHGFGFVYPPTGAYLLTPFTLGEPFWFVWNLVSIVAVVGIALLIVHREVGGLSPPMAFVAGAIIITAFQPGLTGLLTGYLSPMVAAAVGSMWLWPRWSAVPSLLFGLVKVFPASGLLWTVRMGGAWRGPLLGASLFAGVVTIAHPSFVTDWVVALGNAEAGCPEFALPSFACVGLSPLVGYLACAALLVASWRASRDDVAFLLLGLGMTAPFPDIYWGNVMVPMMASIPLLIRESRRWLAQGQADVPASVEPVITEVMQSQS